MIQEGVLAHLCRKEDFRTAEMGRNCYRFVGSNEINGMVHIDLCEYYR